MTRPGLLGPPRRARRSDPDRLPDLGPVRDRGRSSWHAGERVEALGFASLFANDHLMPILGDADGPVLGSTGPVFEGWMTLGAWAARTTRIPLGVMVCGVGYRNVGLTVKMATALDHASDGRAMLGLGAGWHEPEHRAFGYELLDAGRPDQPVRRGEPAGPRHARRGAIHARTVGGSARTRSATIRRPSRPDAAPHRRQRRAADAADRRPRRRHLERRGRPGDVRAQERGPRRAVRRDRSRPGLDPAHGRRPAGLHPGHRARRRSRRSPRSWPATAVDPPQARAWAASSPLADTEEAVIGLFRAWRAAGAEEAVVDLPCPIDDETFERLAGPVRERLAS